MGTLIRHAATLTARRCLSVALFVGAYLLVAHLVPATMTYAEPQPAPVVEPTRAEVLAERHDCWQGEAPEDVDMPGHVVWQHPDGRTVYSARLVGPALDTLFGDGNLAGSPVAFCR